MRNRKNIKKEYLDRFPELLGDEYSFLDDFNLEMLVLNGSVAYGTNHDDSDLDLIGVYFPSLDYLFDDKVKMYTYVAKENGKNVDVALYSIFHYIQMALSSNPNIIGSLYSEPDDYLYLSDVGQKILDCREMFLSKKIVQSFSGYSRGQIQRIRNHYSENLNKASQSAYLVDILNNSLQTISDKYELDSNAISFKVKTNSGHDVKINGLDVTIDDVKISNNKSFIEIDGENIPLEGAKILVSMNYEDIDFRPFALLSVELKHIHNNHLKSLGQTNTKTSNKAMGKHIAHLYRLMIMCKAGLIDGNIKTRLPQKDIDTISRIRNQYEKHTEDYLNGEFSTMFNNLVSEIRGLSITSLLKDEPDYDEARKLLKELTLSNFENRKEELK